jgi:hypothetical protein
MRLLRVALTHPGPAPGVQVGSWAKKRLDEIAADRRLSYRDGALVLLAFAVVNDGRIDVTSRPPGARTVSQYLGREIWLDLHIHGTDDAFANIGKNNDSLVRGNFKAWDELLSWISDDTTPLEEIEKAFEYLAALVAATASPPVGWTELDQTDLTFAKVTTFLADLLSRKSGGAYEQFAFAALLKVAKDQETGGRLAVSTKGIDVSDASAGVLGDVQVSEGDKVLEVYEVTANRWDTKIAQATRTLRTGGVDQVVIVGDTSGESVQQINSELRAGDDIAVVDIVAELCSLASRLTRDSRSAALRELHRLLTAERSRPHLLVDYVDLLSQHGLSDTDQAPPKS